MWWWGCICFPFNSPPGFPDEWISRWVESIPSLKLTYSTVAPENQWLEDVCPFGAFRPIFSFHVKFRGYISGFFVPHWKSSPWLRTEHPRWNSPHVSRSNIKAHWPLLGLTAETQAARAKHKICRYMNIYIYTYYLCIYAYTYLNMYTSICLYIIYSIIFNIHVNMFI